MNKTGKPPSCRSHASCLVAFGSIRLLTAQPHQANGRFSHERSSGTTAGDGRWTAANDAYGGSYHADIHGRYDQDRRGCPHQSGRPRARSAGVERLRGVGDSSERGFPNTRRPVLRETSGGVCHGAGADSSGKCRRPVGHLPCAESSQLQCLRGDVRQRPEHPSAVS
jgi:hypothetical protein